MFNKLLIANRGEIACRVVRTARRMGIATVAVYSEADARALHVRMADEAIAIGPSAAADSYLRIERIVDACAQSGADAVHPGYGFLSENASFAEALEARGIVFIGPPASAIRSMGDKLVAKRLAEQAGVNVIPGCSDPIPHADAAVEMAQSIGYPVMLKAAAGGGGKGMRVASDDQSCREGFERATSEALSSFGDARLFVEKYISEPRHIEIQVLADAHGNTVHLGERECSVQRRHQKVVEEAPSALLDARTRAEMGAQAVALARAVDYRSAGTVEFVADQRSNFYFLEMNTRLQVEHPVTEMVTGLDLVELMLRVSAGEPLPFDQSAVATDGWALEARIYAEDPERDFLPSTGRLMHFASPAACDGVRVDTGVDEGDEVSMFYDPMIAKLVTHAGDRAGAIDRMLDALDRFGIQGVSNNALFLAAIIDHPRFREGRLSTDLIADEYPDGFRPDNVGHEGQSMFHSVAAIAHDRTEHRDFIDSRRSQARLGREWVVIDAGERYPVRLESTSSRYQIDSGDSRFEVDAHWRPGDPQFELHEEGSSRIFLIVPQPPDGYVLHHRGRRRTLRVLSPRAAALDTFMPEKRAADTSRFLLSPMPGLLISLSVRAGDLVKSGQPLAVIEAMKMENVLRASRDAVVANVVAQAGARLSVDQPLIEFE